MNTNPLPRWFPMRSLYRNWAASILLAAGVSTADAATLFWDSMGGSPGAQGGSGNWLTSNGGHPWWDGSANTSWVDGSSATFGGAGSLVDSGGVVVDDITFDASNYVLQLGSSTGSLTLGMGDGVHDIICNGDATISVPLAGTQGFTKSGAAILTLVGTTNFYTGPTMINEGQIITSGNGIGDSSPVTIASGATLTVKGSEAIGGLSGAGTVSVVSLGGSTPNFSAGGGSDTIFSGMISGTGFFTKTGSGTLTLSGKISNLGTQISGGTLAVSNPDGVTNGNFIINSTGTLRLLADQKISGLTGSGSVDLGTRILTILGSGDFSGNISGTGGLAADGGPVVLKHAVTYTGPTTVKSGTLVFQTNAIIPPSSAATVESGATLQLNDNPQTIGELSGGGTIYSDEALTIGSNNTSTTFSGAITSYLPPPGQTNIPVTKVGTGTLTLSGVNTYTGLTTVSAGTLALAGGNALPNSKAVTISAAGTLRLLANETLGGINGAGAVALDAGAILSIPNLAGYTGTISGAGGLTMTGTGTSTLSGTHTFSGGLTITLGSVSVAQPGNTATGGPLGRGLVTLGTAGSNSNLTVTTTGAVSSDLPLAVGSGTIAKSGAGTLTLSGPISGNAALRISGNILLNGTTSSFAGGTIVSAGKLQVSGGQALPDTGTLSFFTGTTFELLSGSDETVGSLAGEATVILGGQRLTSGGDGTSTQFSGVISGTGGSQIEKRGNSTLTLTSPNSSFSGGVLISEGVISVPSIGNVGSNSPLGNDGTITLGDASHSGGLRVTGMGTYSTDRPFNVSAGGGSIDFGGNELSLSGALTGSGTLTKLGSGRLRLTGSSSYSGEVALTQGSLRIEGQLAAASFSVASGTTLDTASGTSPNVGRLTLTGGTVEVGGTGGAGSLATGEVLFSSGTLSIDLKDGTSAGYDHLDVTGGITFDGTVTLALQLDYDPEDYVDVIRVFSNDGTDPTSLLGSTARFFYDGRILEEGQTFLVTSGPFSQYFQMHYGLDGSDNDVRLVAAPEPGTAGLLGVGAILGLVRRWRKISGDKARV